MELKPHLNSFQEWAIKYAADFGVIVVPTGNWVTVVRRDGVEFDVYSVAGVKAVCK